VFYYRFISEIGKFRTSSTLKLVPVSTKFHVSVLKLTTFFQENLARTLSKESCLDALNIVGGKINFSILLKGKWKKKVKNHSHIPYSQKTIVCTNDTHVDLQRWQLFLFILQSFYIFSLTTVKKLSEVPVELFDSSVLCKHAACHSFVTFSPFRTKLRFHEWLMANVTATCPMHCECLGQVCTTQSTPYVWIWHACN